MTRPPRERSGGRGAPIRALDRTPNPAPWVVAEVAKFDGLSVSRVAFLLGVSQAYVVEARAVLKQRRGS